MMMMGIASAMPIIIITVSTSITVMISDMVTIITIMNTSMVVIAHESLHDHHKGFLCFLQGQPDRYRW